MIFKNSNVSGGEACIGRIPIWILVQAKQFGMSDDAILKAYPTLNADDLADAWEYHRVNADEIAKQITDNESA